MAAARPLWRLLAISLSLLLAACSNPGPSPSQSGGQGAGSQAPGAPTQSAGPKILRLAVHEPLEELYGGSGNVAREVGETFNAGLTYLDHQGELQPRLAQKIPSVNDGDWRVNSDGTMEVTWKLKPNLKWHDGTALTAEDFAFTVRMFNDPASRFAVPFAIRFIDDVQAVDAQTVIFKYRRVFNGANSAHIYDLPPVPRHLLQDQYAQSGAEGLANSPVWTSAWVGLGPFRVTNLIPGNQVDGEAFSDYVMGRPNIDRVVVRIIPDVNTIVANLLAGELDGVPVGALEATHGAELRRQYEAPARGMVGIEQNRLRQVQIQFRDPSLPWATDVRVRQAVMHLIDRQGIVDSIMAGVTSVANIAALPNSRLFNAMEQRGYTRYAFDRAAGERLLDQAGWPKGADGVRRNAAGAPFVWNPAVSGEPDLPEALVIVDSFKAAGISSEPDLISDSLSSNEKNERRGRAHSITRSAAVDHSYWDRYLRVEISSQENRWRGSNTGGYFNPQFEALFDQWRVTLDPAARTERAADMQKLLVDEVAYLPLFYNIDVFAFRKGVVGPKVNNSDSRGVMIDLSTWKLE